jgi:hypothetical protein
MPRRYLDGAPAIVAAQALDLFRISPAAPLDFDLILKPDPADSEVAGLDFGAHGAQGQHYFLTRPDMRAYRDRNRRRRVAWADLPGATQRAIVAYLEWEPGK